MGMGDHEEYCYEDDCYFQTPADYDSEIESQLDDDDWEDDDYDDIGCEFYDDCEDFYADESIGGFMDCYYNPYND